MKEDVRCKCKGGCQNRRCACLKSNRACVEDCECVGCKNPLQGIDPERLSLCALQNIHRYKELSEEELNTEYMLPCECEKVPLKKLLGSYECAKCSEAYWFSFCWEDVVQDNCSWHCDVCGHCRDWREWHCKRCNRCTYGVTLPCEYCGAKGKFYGEE